MVGSDMGFPVGWISIGRRDPRAAQNGEGYGRRSGDVPIVPAVAVTSARGPVHGRDRAIRRCGLAEGADSAAAAGAANNGVLVMSGFHRKKGSSARRGASRRDGPAGIRQPDRHKAGIREWPEAPAPQGSGHPHDADAVEYPRQRPSPDARPAADQGRSPHRPARAALAAPMRRAARQAKGRAGGGLVRSGLARFGQHCPTGAPVHRAS